MANVVSLKYIKIMITYTIWNICYIFIIVTTLRAQLQECFRSNINKYRRLSIHLVGIKAFRVDHAPSRTQRSLQYTSNIDKVAALIVWQEFTKRDFVLRARDNILNWTLWYLVIENGYSIIIVSQVHPLTRTLLNKKKKICQQWTF